MWARLLSSTNQPKFIEVKSSNEDKKEENSLDQLEDRHCSEDNSVVQQQSGIHSSDYGTGIAHRLEIRYLRIKMLRISNYRERNEEIILMNHLRLHEK
ncbi:unnamed protein product [Trifolium pratense]|uniref:Uncharacterized protein n=1 Tax=Trifolium pratense TaxID=57577 RepID=A0ACB0IWL7_TRIPR|nr:unnamed protein product [Trifolium pratense]